jgi:CxxC-x17-CxxC domain-containing protein
MEFQDRVIPCIDCGVEFVFTAGEQLFFHDKRLKHEPKRCHGCKAKRLAVVTRREAHGNGRIVTSMTCSACGKETTVPFRPTQNRPVFCRDCFRQRRQIASA